MPSDAPRTVSFVMPLCFIEPQDAIRVIAESVGREARRQLLQRFAARELDLAAYERAVDALSEAGQGRPVLRLHWH